MARPLMAVGFVRPFVVLFARDFVLNHTLRKPCHIRSYMAGFDLARINVQKLVQGVHSFLFVLLF